MSKSINAWYTVKELSGRFTALGLAAQGLTPESENVTRWQDDSPKAGSLRNTVLPFGSFFCGRAEAEIAQEMGFRLVREDQGDGFVQVQAKGMTLDQVADLDAGLRWLDWLVTDGSFRGADGRPKQMQLYGDLGRRLAQFVSHPVIQARLKNVYGFDGKTSMPFAGLDSDYQPSYFEVLDFDNSCNRWFGDRAFLTGPSKLSPPARVVTDSGIVETAHGAEYGDTWARVKTPENPDAYLEQEFRPDTRRLDAGRAWELAMSYLEQVNLVYVAQRDDDGVDHDAGRFLSRPASVVAGERLDSARVQIHSRLGVLKSGKRQWHPAVPTTVQTLLTEAVKDAQQHVRELAHDEVLSEGVEIPMPQRAELLFDALLEKPGLIDHVIDKAPPNLIAYASWGTDLGQWIDDVLQARSQQIEIVSTPEPACVQQSA
jgi:hypothetical protein